MPRHPTLDEIERRPDGPQYRRSLRGGARTENLPLMGKLGGCWCGRRYGHAWEGRDQGAPHPRDHP